MKSRLTHWLEAAPPPAEEESVFREHWLEQAATESTPFRLASRGGLLAGRFSFVFSAGYQAALRYVFPGLLGTDWGAFAVSEGRDGLSGVTYRTVDETVRLTGFKTWVAASDVCTDLIVSAQGGEGWRYFHVRSEADGVCVTTRPPGRVLPDLSQGQVELTGAIATPVATDRVDHFGTSEALFIYVAFLSSTWARFADRRDEVERALDQARDCAESLPIDWDDAMKSLDRAVQSILGSLREGECAEDALWRRDYKLIAMYGKSGR